MNVLIPYASIEGQTLKIARFAEEHVRRAGHEATLVDAGQKSARAEIDEADKVILAASVHRKRHPLGFEKFVAARKAELEGCDTLLISVSLCAAFQNGLDEAGSYVTEFRERTGFTPGAEALVAGALQFEKYHDYESQVVRFIALDLERYEAVDGDREFTDWEALRGVLTGFLEA